MTTKNLGAVILQTALCCPRPALKAMLRTVILHAPRELLQRICDVAVAHKAVPDDRGGSRWESPPAFVLQAVLDHLDLPSYHELTQVGPVCSFVGRSATIAHERYVVQVSRRWRLFVREEPGIPRAFVRTNGDCVRLLRYFSLESARSLTCQSFSSRGCLRVDHCRAILARTPSLTKLGLVGVSLDAIAPQLAALKHLETLGASFTHFTDGACRAVSQLSRLTDLHLVLEDDGAMSAVADFPPSLTRLTLYRSDLLPVNAERISALSQLTHLTVDSVDSLDFLRGSLQQTLTHLAVACVRLPSCTVPDLPKLVVADMRGRASRLECVSMIRCAPHLEKLHIWRCDRPELEALATCRRLRCLEIDGRLDTANLHLLTHLAPLTVLTLHDMDEMVLPMVACCQPSLHELSIRVRGRVSRKSLQCLRPLAQLRFLRVEASVSVASSLRPSVAFSWITSESLPLLRELDISVTGPMFTAEAMASIATHVPRVSWNKIRVRGSASRARRTV